MLVKQVNLNPYILAVRLDVLHLLNNNVISDSNEDTISNLSDPISAKWCVTLVWAEHFIIKVLCFSQDSVPITTSGFVECIRFSYSFFLSTIERQFTTRT